MAAPSPLAIVAYLPDLDDPRSERSQLHRLLGLVVIAPCTVIGGADHLQEGMLGPFRVAGVGPRGGGEGVRQGPVSPIGSSNGRMGNSPALVGWPGAGSRTSQRAKTVQDLRPGGWYTQRRSPRLQKWPVGSPGETCRNRRDSATHARHSADDNSPGASSPGVPPVSEVTRILSAIEQGDPKAAEQLLPLVYDELRQLAAQKLAHETPGQTLQPTALVHEAYLRLVGDQQFANRRHFLAAAAQAMRRILIESARRKRLAPRVQLEGFEPAAFDDDRLLVVHDALERLAAGEPVAARLAEARLFAGLSVEEAAASLGLSRATAYREWTFARAWLAAALGEQSEKA
jgi:RNA polymerase sigma factor (TIGR02999 family)